MQSLFFFWWLITSLGGFFNGSHNKAIIVFSIITASFASVACLSDASCLCLPGGTLNGALWAVLRLGTCKVSPPAPSLQEFLLVGAGIRVGLVEGEGSGAGHIWWRLGPPPLGAAFQPFARLSAADTSASEGSQFLPGR